MSEAGRMARGRGGNPAARLASVARNGGSSTPQRGSRASVARRIAAEAFDGQPVALHVSDNDEIGEVSQSQGPEALTAAPLGNDTTAGGSAPASIRQRGAGTDRRDVLQPAPRNASPRGEGPEVAIGGEKSIAMPAAGNDNPRGGSPAVQIAGERTMRGRQARRQGSERQQA